MYNIKCSIKNNLIMGQILYSIYVKNAHYQFNRQDSIFIRVDLTICDIPLFMGK